MGNTLRNIQENTKYIKTTLDAINYAFHKQYITNEKKHQCIHNYHELMMEQIRMFNHHNSTSISEANYIRLEKAIFYIVQHAYGMPLYQFLSSHTLHELYDKGILRLKMDVAQLTQDVKQLQAHALPFVNERYRDVLYEQLPTYLEKLKSYDAMFCYHHTNKDLDYPLIDGIPLFSHMYGLDGTDLVKEYVKRLKIEESFCIRFKQDLSTFLEQYEQQKGILLIDIHVNLFEILLQQSFANIMLCQKEGLFLDEQAVHPLRHNQNSPYLMQEAKHRIQVYISSLDEDLQVYIHRNKSILQSEWEKFFFHDVQLCVFKQAEANLLHVKLPPTSTSFIKYLDDLQTYFTLEQKLHYIEKHRISIYDIIDLLEHNIFMNEEYHAYFQTMERIDTALLLKLQLPQLQAFHQSTSLMKLLQEYECEFVWQNAWKHFLLQLPYNIQEEILIIARKISIDPS